MAMQECKRAILGKALEDLVARARSGKEPCRIGLMASGGEHSDAVFLAAASAAIPMGKPGRPEDVAAAIAFLAGERAEYITGQLLCIDGGMGM